MKNRWKKFPVFFAALISAVLILIATYGSGNGAQVLASTSPTIWEKLQSMPTYFVENLDKAFKDYTGEFDLNPPVCTEWVTLLNDCSNTAYQPQNQDAVSKAYIAKMLVDKYNLPFNSNYLQITDVPNNHPCYNYIATLVNDGYITLYPDGSYYPDYTVNRAEAAKLVTTVGKYPLYEGSVQAFRDVPTSIWYYRFVSTLFQKTGLDYGLFETNRLEKLYRPSEVVNYKWLNNILGGLTTK